MRKNEFRLAVGDLVLGMSFTPARYAAIFRRYFDCECSQKIPDIRLNIEISRLKMATEIEDSLFTSKAIRKSGFEMAGGLVSGVFNRGTRDGRIRLDKILTVVPTIRVFEQLLYQAYYSASDTNDHNEVLLHSAGVLHRGFGYLFVGCPGSGKSTVARLSLPDAVLNDEMNLICFSKAGVEVKSTPFNGLFTEKSPGNGRLNAVLLLKQGSAHRLIKANEVEAVKFLMREIVPPIGLDEVITPVVRTAMLDIADRIQRSVPVYWLEFERDRGFWELLDKEFTQNGGSA